MITVAFPGDYGKARPALIIQSDLFNIHPSITVLPITSALRDASFFRITIEPNEENGLQSISQVMVDKTHTIPREKAGITVGKLNADTMLNINRALAVFLDFG